MPLKKPFSLLQTNCEMILGAECKKCGKCMQDIFTTCIFIPLSITSSANNKLSSKMPVTLIVYFLVTVRCLNRLDTINASSQSIY